MGLSPLIPIVWSEVRLLRRLQQAGEPPPLRIDAFSGLLRDGVYGDVHVLLIYLTNGHPTVASHCTVHRHLSKHRAINTVVRVGANRANHVRRVDVLDTEGPAELLESRCDLVLQPWPHVGQQFVSTCVGPARTLDERIAAPFCDHDDSVPLSLHQILCMLEHLLEADLHLGQEADIHAASGERSVHGNEPTMPAHELHKPNAVCVAARLHIGRLHALHRLGAGGVKAESLVEHRHVVVDCLGDAYDCALVVYVKATVEGLHGALVGAVSTEDEVLPDVHAL
mmetsp:Transcript_3718/g.10448  ORF Transcript_3718/g.10448 Transcript_3718/m.10448 type:complete len:282 (-) Transcript_3718:1661-2506(-)